MSIETDIQSLTAAIKELTAAISATHQATERSGRPIASTPTGNTESSAPEQPQKEAREPANKKKEPASTSATTEEPAGKPAEKQASAGTEGGATPQSTAETAAPGITFKDLSAEFVKLVQKDYAKAKEICDREGVAKISGLDAKHYARVHAEVVGLLGA